MPHGQFRYRSHHTHVIVVAVASWLVSYSMYVKWSKAWLPTTQLLCWAKHSSSHWTVGLKEQQKITTYSSSS